MDLNVVTPKPCKWITDSTWLNLVELSSLYQFSGILEQVAHNEKQWKHWFGKEAPEEETIPDGYNSLDVFRRLLLVRCWCPDRTLSQSRKYVEDTLGENFAEGVILDVEKMWGESNNRSPLVGLLSMGSDPTPSIESLAKKLKIGKYWWYRPSSFNLSTATIAEEKQFSAMAPYLVYILQNSEPSPWAKVKKCMPVV